MEVISIIQVATAIDVENNLKKEGNVKLRSSVYSRPKTKNTSQLTDNVY